MFGFFELRGRPARRPARCSTPPRSGCASAGATAWSGRSDFTTNDECGVLVEGFDREPLILSRGTPPYYPGLLEGAGLTKAMDLLHVGALRSTTARSVHPAICASMAEKVETEHGIDVRRMRKRDLRGRGRPLPRGLQRGLGAQLGLRAAHRRGGAPLRQGAQADPRRELGLDRREGRRDGRRRAHAARLQPGADAHERPPAADRLGEGPVLAPQDRPRAACSRWASSPSTSTPASPPSSTIEHFDSAARTPQKGGEMGWILETNKAMNRGHGGHGRKDRQAATGSTSRSSAIRCRRSRSLDCRLRG